MRASLLTVATSALAVLLGAPVAVDAPLSSGAAAVTTDRTSGEPVWDGDDRRVLAISVDGLNPAALRRLGPEGAPALHRLLREGASTRNARSSYEMTVTLPNHVSMVTGRRIDASRGGHGVTWNDDRPGTTVQQAAGHRVASVFSVVHRHGGSSAVFATKTKLSLLDRSWPGGVDRFVADEDDWVLVRAARDDLVAEQRRFTFVHLASPDSAGHAHGFMSADYVTAVAEVDRQVAVLLRAIDRRPALAARLVVLLTADHGGVGPNHDDRAQLGDYRVPFLAWGAGVDRGDLYEMNPELADPGRTRPTYAAPRQPVRNGMVANLALDLLGLGPVPGSEHDADQELDVHR